MPSFTRDFNMGGHGEIAGSATAAQMPTISARLVNFKAQNDNAGDVFIGLSNAVTVAAGNTDVTTGWQLAAGEETGWLPCGNLDEFWRICDNAGDDLVYLFLL